MVLAFEAALVVVVVVELEVVLVCTDVSLVCRSTWREPVSDRLRFGLSAWFDDDLLLLPDKNGSIPDHELTEPASLAPQSWLELLRPLDLERRLPLVPERSFGSRCPLRRRAFLACLASSSSSEAVLKISASTSASVFLGESENSPTTTDDLDSPKVNGSETDWNKEPTIACKFPVEADFFTFSAAVMARYFIV